MSDASSPPAAGGATRAVAVGRVARGSPRWMWGRLEAIHTLHYFSPDVHRAHAALGLAERQSAYIASRSAPFGPVGPELVTAAFYGFSPRSVAAAVPAVWSIAAPDLVLATSLQALREVLHELLRGAEAEVALAAELLREAAAFHPVIGRPLAAAWAGVSWHDDEFVRLWQAATIIRESRGDGHVACLMDAQLDGVEAHLMTRGDGERVRAILSSVRGHTDPEWDAAAARLVDRGLLSSEGSLTADGVSLRDHVETRTDVLATPPWDALGPAVTARVAETVEPLVARILAAGVLPGIVVRAATS